VVVVLQILTQKKDKDPTYKPLTMPYAQENSDDVSYLDQVDELSFSVH